MIRMFQVSMTFTVKVGKNLKIDASARPPPKWSQSPQGSPRATAAVLRPRPSTGSAAWRHGDPVDAREPAESTGWLSPKSQGWWVRWIVLHTTTVDGSEEILHHQFGMVETL